MTNGYWNEYEKASQEESGGGGIIGKVRVETGYKVYVGGFAQEETFFGAGLGERDAAKSKAQSFANNSGAPGTPRWGIQIRVYRDGALSRGEPVTWAGDRFFNTDSWTEACKDVVIPSLKDNNVAPPWEGWARVGFKPDPFKVAKGESGMTDMDQSGNPRYPQVAYVVEVFANEAEAKTGVTASQSASVASSLNALAAPQAWIDAGGDEASWGEVLDSLDGLTPAEIRTTLTDYGVEVTLPESIKLQRALAERVPV